jgi:branched-chain amino acid transport system permease protein
VQHRKLVNLLTLCCLILFTFSIPSAVESSFYIHIFIMSAINAVLAIGLNLIMGFIGEKSLGHAAFYGIGAYATAIMSIHFGLSGPLNLVVALLVTLLCALVIGIPSLRLRGPYFAIVTLGFVLILQLLILNGGVITGGPMGLPGIKRLRLPGMFGGNGFVLSTDAQYYYGAMIFFWIAMLISMLSLRSRMGRAWLAIRENMDLAESVGISAFRYKLVAFLIGAGLAGLVGALYTHYIGFISPKIIDTWINVLLAAMVIVGGEGTVLGPVVGAVLLTMLPEVLRFAEGYRMLLYGVILLVVIMFAPQGIVGLVTDLAKRDKRA